MRLDRLARSVSHLLDVIEGLEEKGAHFRSLRDPIDTSTPQGRSGWVESLNNGPPGHTPLSERTKAGVRAAKARGRLPGNPGLRTKDPAAIRKITVARDGRYTREVAAAMDSWAPIVKAMRPASAWEDVVSVFNRRAGKSWTVERLKRAVRRAARERFIDAKYLSRSPRKPGDDRLVMLVAGIALANPDLSLRAIGAQLEAMRERTPHGGRQWSASSVKNLLDQARKLGMS